MKEYVLTTNKTWSRTNGDIEATMRSWGISEWSTNYPKGARSEGVREQSLEDRTVTITYVKGGKTINLSMGKQKRAVDNLRVLYIALDSMRLNELRGIGELLQAAYLQIAGPVRAKSPYEVLNIFPGSPLPIAEAAYKFMAVSAHPDRGGSEEEMRELNQAIQQIRDEAK